MNISQHDNLGNDTPSINQTSTEPGALSIFSDFDLYLFGQGKNYRIYEKMGAHLRTFNGVAGVHFAVWAPNALSVSVIGDFNGWQRGATLMDVKPPRAGSLGMLCAQTTSGSPL